jgi:uncharacterized protein YyaL (SSP411 family)
MRSGLLNIMILAATVMSCCNRNDIIKENIGHAKEQLAYLIEAAESDSTLRIPSTFKNGKVVFVPAKDWVSGFFAGSLWYMYELTGDEYYAEKAQKHTEILHDIQYLTSHHDIGFMINNSYGNGLRLKEIPGYDTVLVNAARSLATRFRPGAGIIQSWNVTTKGWQSQQGWECPVIIDNMMNLELLFKVSSMTADPTFWNIAVSHADKTLEHHYREDFSTYHVVDFDPETGEVRRKCTAQGIADESRWARGQAWSLYGFTIAYRYTGGKKYLQRAEDIADYLLVKEDNMPEDLVPLWDFDVMEFAADSTLMESLFGDKDVMTPYLEVRDASSAAIIASALYELYGHTGKKLYKAKADKMIESLSSPAYRAETGTHGGFLLMHSTSSVPHSIRALKYNPNGGNVDIPLNYADYYFLEALVRKSRIENGKEPINF